MKMSKYTITIRSRDEFITRLQNLTEITTIIIQSTVGMIDSIDVTMMMMTMTIDSEIPQGTPRLR